MYWRICWLFPSSWSCCWEAQSCVFFFSLHIWFVFPIGRFLEYSWYPHCSDILQCCIGMDNFYSMRRILCGSYQYGIKFFVVGNLFKGILWKYSFLFFQVFLLFKLTLIFPALSLILSFLPIFDIFVFLFSS